LSVIVLFLLPITPPSIKDAVDDGDRKEEARGGGVAAAQKDPVVTELRA
jgi:hypothetical protein